MISKITAMILHKTQSANLENKRGIFLEIGLIFSLIMVLLAFNWKTDEKGTIQYYQRTAEDVLEELVPITQQKPPDPPKINIPQAVTVINIVDNEMEVDDDIIIDVDIDASDAVPEYIPVPVLKEEEGPADEQEIFKVVESMPGFPGGEAALYTFLANNMKYPEMAKAAGISGKVYITFVVETDGSITDVKILRGIGGGCDEEAVRVIQSMPSWTPGKQRNMPVRVQYVLDIKFTLSQI